MAPSTHSCVGRVGITLASLARLLPRSHWLTTPMLRDRRPSFKKEALTENKDINHWIDKYLGVGEWVMDQSVAIAGSSPWFERKR
jgi:hypothetical protein